MSILKYIPVVPQPAARSFRPTARSRTMPRRASPRAHEFILIREYSGAYYKLNKTTCHTCHDLS